MHLIRVKKWKLVIAICALVICITQIQQTYAKYLDSKEGDTDFQVAQWKILVNNQDITEAATMSSLITPVYIANEHMKDGVIAPGRKGYFDLMIDSSNTEVSFQYNISIMNSENSSVKDLKITGYQINDGTLIPANDELNNIHDTIYYNNPTKLNKIRVYFEWIDGAGETMDNASDTYASIQGQNAKLKVNLSFTQVAQKNHN